MLTFTEEMLLLLGDEDGEFLPVRSTPSSARSQGRC